MSGALQAVFQNQRSFGPPPPGAIGSAYQGGFYAGQIGVAGVATHYLIVAPVSSGESASIKYQNANNAIPGAGSVIDGPQNTADMVAHGNSTVYPAAHFCNDASIGGFTDWYMPAKNELEICYYNLKPTTTLNPTSSGNNFNAVPTRSNYTAGTPAQTSAAAFKDTGVEDFAAAYYWASTEPSATTAWFQFFASGIQYYEFNKFILRRVRCVRRSAI
jgi:hypothetical protein